MKRTLKTAREKQRVTYKGTFIKISATFSAETLQARKEWHDIFKVLKVKSYNLGYPTQQNYHSELKER